MMNGTFLPADILWRRVDVSREAYLGVSAAASLTLSAVAVAGVWVVASILLGLEMPSPPEVGPNPIEILLGWVLFAPLAETLVLALLVGVARRVTRNERVQVLVAALPMGAAHALQRSGAVDAVGDAVVSTAGFLVFAAVYVAWRRDSLRDAYGMGVGVHMIHNGVVGIVALIVG